MSRALHIEFPSPNHPLCSSSSLTSIPIMHILLLDHHTTDIHLKLCDLPVKFLKQHLILTWAAVGVLEDKAIGVRKQQLREEWRMQSKRRRMMID
jgi:hypothetical protein